MSNLKEKVIGEIKKINVKGSSTKGKIEIEFSSLEELNKIIGHIK